MDTNQTLKIVNKYFNTLEVFGSYDSKSFIALLYLMFIDEYYEFNRDISLKDIDNDEIGLTDCLVKTLNNKLEYLKNNATILRGVELDYLPTKNHWIIISPDIPEEDDAYIENGVLITNDIVENHILKTSREIVNKILQL